MKHKALTTTTALFSNLHWEKLDIRRLFHFTQYSTMDWIVIGGVVAVIVFFVVLNALKGEEKEGPAKECECPHGNY